MKADIHSRILCSHHVTCSWATVRNPFDLVQSHWAIDVCNECHPFYTGKQKTLDTGGRVQRFADRFGAFGKKARLLQRVRF